MKAPPQAARAEGRQSWKHGKSLNISENQWGKSRIWRSVWSTQRFFCCEWTPRTGCQFKRFSLFFPRVWESVKAFASLQNTDASSCSQQARRAPLEMWKTLCVYGRQSVFSAQAIHDMTQWWGVPLVLRASFSITKRLIYILVYALIHDPFLRGWILNNNSQVLLCEICSTDELEPLPLWGVTLYTLLSHSEFLQFMHSFWTLMVSCDVSAHRT